MSTDPLQAPAGLSSPEAAEKLRQFGPNALPEKPPKAVWRVWLEQFQSPLIYILVAALLIDTGVWWYQGGHDFPAEAVAILIILLVNAALGVWQEHKSGTALAKLKALAAPQSWVMRDGQLIKIASVELVSGDVLRLEAGERVPADGIFLKVSSVAVDESMLTGESLPIAKDKEDQASSGSLLVRGSGWIEVTATGAQSSMGKLSALLSQVEEQASPLEVRMRAFGNRIGLVVIILALILLFGGIKLLGLAQAAEVFLFAVALAVAAVPESLPAVITLAMSLGMERMADKKAVVRKLASVEALGSVTVIATDKTGTLTENAMLVERIEAEDEAAIIRAMVLVNDSSLEQGVGDPLELGLLKFAVARGANLSDLRSQFPRLAEKPFDSQWKYMRVTVQEGGQSVSYLKGAPEVLLASSALTEEQQQSWLSKIEQHAAQGYRTLAFAQGAGDTESALQFLGLALLWDPPRAEVPDAIARAQAAGIRVLMMTGDHPATARAIAEKIGIPADLAYSGAQLTALSKEQFGRAISECSVFARVQPEHKLRIVETLRAQGQIVAVTGDGINDAPALKAADVGIAMGQRGSDVSREVADLVLLDDNFATIVAAVEEGRNIYANLIKFIRLLFSANLAEVVLLGIGAFISFAAAAKGQSVILPLTATQILWVNLLTDSLPAISMALDRNQNVLSYPPRAVAAPLVDGVSKRFILTAGIGIGLICLLLSYCLLPRLGMSEALARSTVFCYLVIAQLVLVFPVRTLLFAPAPNRYVVVAIVLSLGLQGLVMTLPWARQLLGVELLTGQALLLLLLALAITALGVLGLVRYLTPAKPYPSQASSAIG